MHGFFNYDETKMRERPSHHNPQLWGGGVLMKEIMKLLECRPCEARSNPFQ